MGALPHEEGGRARPSIGCAPPKLFFDGRRRQKTEAKNSARIFQNCKRLQVRRKATEPHAEGGFGDGGCRRLPAESGGKLCGVYRGKRIRRETPPAGAARGGCVRNAAGAAGKNSEQVETV